MAVYLHIILNIYASTPPTYSCFSASQIASYPATLATAAVEGTAMIEGVAASRRASITLGMAFIIPPPFVHTPCAIYAS